MPKYLFAAEADKIQDFVFRSSRLSGVVGGSQLLTRFCREGAVELFKKYDGKPETDIIINDGGAFRIIFNNSTKAKKFGEELSELYRRIVGSSLTITEPVKLDDNFPFVSEEAQKELRKAKSACTIPTTSIHLPYIAFCASCGIAIANKRYSRRKNARPIYYCSSCFNKKNERDSEYEKLKNMKDNESFLGRFQKAVLSICHEKLEKDFKVSLPQETEDIGNFDITGKRYVAYLIADGNGMGVTFGNCPDEKIMKELSDTLPGVLYESLAAPCNFLVDRILEFNNSKEKKNNILPVLPLILGGDDLFALIPASWAIDFAYRFCKAYETKMTEKLDKLGLLGQGKTPTIAAAVVICKANYPYTLAHRQGEELLAEAKKLARGIEVNNNIRTSVLNFTVITGNEVIKHTSEYELSEVRPTARPYLINNILPEEIEMMGIPIHKLIDNRYELSALSSKRCSELNRLYDNVIKFCNINEIKQYWKPQLTELLNRIELRQKSVHPVLRKTLVQLGDMAEEENGYWREINRGSISKLFFGHGLPDLLQIWDYAFDLSKNINEYRG